MSQKSGLSGLARLSPRERQVYEIRQTEIQQKDRKPKSWAEIAQAIGIAVKTAEIHYAHAREKLTPQEPARRLSLKERLALDVGLKP